MTDPTPATPRWLPSVSLLLAQPQVERWRAAYGRNLVHTWLQEALAEVRDRLQTPETATFPDRAAVLEAVLAEAARQVDEYAAQRLGPALNATGIVLHTGLGRAPLCTAAVDALGQVAGATNLEVDAATGVRRPRGHQLEGAWRALTGAPASLVVNNNAAATLLLLQALCAGREVLISRGQLIEIGGSFRLPDIFSLSGALLREVGTTNRTRLDDYAAAIGPQTAAILHVHPSNYRLVGFTEAPEIDALVSLAHARGIWAFDDIGSGSLVEVTRWGWPAEPTFSHSLRAGADVVLGSGDKLLGGPQCGILLGHAELVARLARHPLARAVRIDKLTLGALAATLDVYLHGGAETEIPTLVLLRTPVAELRTRAERICQAVVARSGWCATVRDAQAPVGGGTLPALVLPTAVVALRHAQWPAEQLARRLRTGPYRVWGRIHEDEVYLDLRSVLPRDDSRLAAAVADLAQHPAR